MQDDSYSFGPYLQNIRLTKQIGLEEVSKQTRIRTETLVRIENEDHDRLPEEIYVKGFLRAYARVVGADGDEVIRRYGINRKMNLRAGARQYLNRRRKAKSRAGILLLSVLLIGTAALVIHVTVFQEGEIASIFQRSGESETVNAEQEASAPIDNPATGNLEVRNSLAGSQEPTNKKETSNTGSAPSMLSDKTKPGKPDRLLLSIEAVENTRLKIIIDDQKPKDFKLNAGDKLEFDAESGYNLLIGSATGVKLEFNHKPYGIPGRHGQAVNIILP